MKVMKGRGGHEAVRSKSTHDSDGLRFTRRALRDLEGMEKSLDLLKDTTRSFKA